MALWKIVDDFNISEESRALLLLTKAPTPFLDLFTVRESSDQNKHLWYEENEGVYEGTLTAAITAAATTGITANAEFIAVLAPNYVIQIEDEQMIVDSVDTQAGTFSVKTRGHGGTAAATHAQDTQVSILGKAEPEGTVTDSFIRSPRVLCTNYFQEMTEDILVTKRAARKMHKDYNDMIQEEREARNRKMLMQLNKSLMYGYKNFDEVNGQHTFAGFKQQVEDRSGVTKATIWYTTFDAAAWKNIQKELHDRNSEVDTIVCNGETRSTLIGVVGSAYSRNVDAAAGNASLGVYFDGIIAEDWDGRLLRFVVDKNMKTGEMAMVASTSLGLVPAKDNDGTDLMSKIVAEPTSSAQIQETLRTELSVEVLRADTQAYLTGVN